MTGIQSVHVHSCVVWVSWLFRTCLEDKQCIEILARELIVAVRRAWAALPTKGGGGGMGEKFAYVVDLQQSEAPATLDAGGQQA